MPLNLLWSSGACAVENKPTGLTACEREIGKRLGISDEALAEIRAALKPEMATVKMGGLEEPDNGFVEFRGTQQPLLPEDRRQYLKIAAAYPALNSIVKQPLEINSGQFSVPDAQDVNPGVNRMERVSRAIRKHVPLMTQEELDNPPTGSAKAGAWGTSTKFLPPTIETDKKGAKHGVVRTVTEGFPPPGVRTFKTDKEAEDFIAETNKRYAGKKLRKENLGTLYLGLRYFSKDPSDPPADVRIPQLREKLLMLGFRIVENSSFERKVTFKSRPAAEAFLQEYGLNKSKDTFEDQTPRQMNVIFPVNWQKDLTNLEDAKTIVRQNEYYGPSDPATIGARIEELRKRSKLYEESQPDQYFKIYPGAEITKLGGRRWRMKIPRRCIVTVIMHSAIVIKAQPGPGYELLRLRHTQGIKPFIDSDQIIEKLKYWDKKYSIVVLDANQFGLTVRFANLPKDLTSLCDELLQLCPHLCDPDIKADRKEKKRILIDNLRRTKQVQIIWK